MKLQQRRFLFLKSRYEAFLEGEVNPFTLSVKNKRSDSPTKITLSFIRDILTLNDKQRPEGHWTKKQLIACLWNSAPVSSLCLSENRVSLVWPASAAGRKAHSFNCPQKCESPARYHGTGRLKVKKIMFATQLSSLLRPTCASADTHSCLSNANVRAKLQPT